MAGPQNYTDDDVFYAARWLGLDRAIELMPDDVREAYANAQRTVALLPRTVPNETDPWAPEPSP